MTPPPLATVSNRAVPKYDPSRPQDLHRWAIIVRAYLDSDGQVKKLPLTTALDQPRGTRAGFMSSQYPDRAPTDTNDEIEAAWLLYQNAENVVYSTVYNTLVMWPGVLDCPRMINVLKNSTLDTTRDGFFLFRELMSPAAYGTERQQDSISGQLSSLSHFASDMKSTRSPFRTSLDSLDAFSLNNFLEQWYTQWCLHKHNSPDDPRSLILLQLKLLGKPEFCCGPLKTWADATHLAYKLKPSTYSTMRDFLDDARDVSPCGVTTRYAS